MKFTVTFKCPDAVQEAIDMALKWSDDPEDDDLRDACEDVSEKFVQWGEMVTVEFDTDGQTARVLPVK